MSYAFNRYYSNAYGRFMTPDPENGGWLANPISLNLYNYTFGDPINSNDPSGLAPTPTCGQTTMTYGSDNLGTLSSLINGTNVAMLAEAVFAESSPSASNIDEKYAVADVILNRFMIVNGYDNIIFNGSLWGAAGPGSEGFGWANGSLAGILGYPGQFSTFQTTTATQTSATLSGTTTSGPLGNLTAALNSPDTSASCSDLIASYWVAFTDWAAMLTNHYSLFEDSTFVPTSFNSFSNPGKSLYFEGNTPVNFGTPNEFYGISPGMVQYNDGAEDPVYSPRPRPRRPRPPR